MSTDPVDVTLSRLRSECDLCGAWSAFTGRTEERDGRTFALVRCPNGHGDFPVWNRDREALVASYVKARAAARDHAALDAAFAALTGSDGAAVSRLLDAPGAALPLFSVEDVPVAAADALRWCELVLGFGGWVPAPTRALRIEEALATAVKYGVAACGDAVRRFASSAEIEQLSDRLVHRLRGSDPAVLAKLLAAESPSVDVGIVRTFAERLCAVVTGSDAEIRSALGVPTTPPPLGAWQCEVTAGVLSRATVELKFSPGIVARAQLDGVLGAARSLPRTGPNAAHTISYQVRVPGAPAMVTVFASFVEKPEPSAKAKNILFRIDPPPAAS